jgi:hypothetical protein
MDQFLSRLGALYQQDPGSVILVLTIALAVGFGFGFRILGPALFG